MLSVVRRVCLNYCNASILLASTLKLEAWTTVTQASCLHPRSSWKLELR